MARFVTTDLSRKFLCFAFAIALSAWLPPVAHAELIAPLGIAGILSPEVAGLTAPRHAGKPDPRWQTFNWRLLEFPTERSKVRLYFYEGEEWAANYALPEIKSEIEYLKGRFSYLPKSPFAYLLFNSHRGFSQTNVFFVSEGVQGITSTTEPIMAIPYWGEAETFRHISTHEMTHQFQVQKINEIGEGGASAEATPLWFIEGMAEYYSLKGMDTQSRYYLRDLVAYEDKKKNHELPSFLETGNPSFITVYKVGQAKIDFLESQFGEGTAQRVLEKAAKAFSSRSGSSFESSVNDILKLDTKTVEARWRDYVKNNYGKEAESLRQDVAKFEQIPETKDTTDHYEISPDGTMIAVRDVDILTGVTELSLIDLSKGNRRIHVDESDRPGALSFYFMQAPIFALGNQRMAYVAETSSGAEIELKNLKRDPDGNVSVDHDRRIRLRKLPFSLQEAQSLALSPDESKLAWVGLSQDGKQNVYVYDLTSNAPEASRIQRLTDDPYSYRELRWTKNGILASSDQTSDKHYGIFRINPETHAIQPVWILHTDLLAPEETASGILFQSWESGSSQIHELIGTENIRRTEAKTAVFYPRLRGDTLYFLAYRSGRFELCRMNRAQLLALRSDSSFASDDAKAWNPKLELINEASAPRYRPFRLTNTRIDQLGGFLGSGGALGLAAHMSDLMRDYHLDAQIARLGPGQSSSHLFLTSKKGRTDWTGGIYYESLPRLDTNVPEFSPNAVYLYRAYGLSGGFRYPFSAFDYAEFSLGLARVSRLDYFDPYVEFQYHALSPGTEYLVSPSFRIGRDRIQYEAFTGAISGYSALFETSYGRYLSSDEITRLYRLDLSYYWKIAGSAVLALEGIGGITNGRFSESFYVSSDDILRAYPFGDIRLLGRYLLAGKAELRYPIGTLFGAPFLRGMIGVDDGSVFDRRADLAERASSSWFAGAYLNFPPISLGLIWATPLRRALNTNPDPRFGDEGSVFHFSLRYLYF